MKLNKPKFAGAISAALFTAIICIISQIAIPSPLGVPFTLQTFAIALCGYLLGVKWSVCAVVVYILIGAIGVPVFSSFRGGAQALISATGGFIIGFLFLSAACSISVKLKRDIFKILLSLGGLLLCHMIGALQFGIVSEIGFFKAFMISSLPFLIKDIISVIAAFYIANKIIKKRRF